MSDNKDDDKNKKDNKPIDIFSYARKKKGQLPFGGANVGIEFHMRISYLDDDDAFVDLRYDTDDPYHNVTDEGLVVLMDGINYVLSTIKSEKEGG